MLEREPRRTLVSVNGVGAYDHVSRARMLQALWEHESLRDLLPFVRLWLGRDSTYV